LGLFALQFIGALGALDQPVAVILRLRLTFVLRPVYIDGCFLVLPRAFRLRYAQIQRAVILNVEDRSGDIGRSGGRRGRRRGGSVRGFKGG
jgi:hypothetical protein